MPSRCRASIASRDVGFTASATTNAARDLAAPAREHRRSTGSRRGVGHGTKLRVRGCAECRRPSRAGRRGSRCRRPSRAHTETGLVRRTTSARPARDPARAPRRRSRGRSGARTRPPPSRRGAGPALVFAGPTTASTSVMRPVVIVPVLSSTAVSTWRVASRTSPPLMTIPSWAPRPVPTMIAVGRRQTERARAGDDQHRDRGGERLVRGMAGEQPRRERPERDEDHDRHEDARDPVRQPLHRRLGALRLGDQPADLRERGLAPDVGRLDDEPARRVQRRAEHGVAGADVDRAPAHR